ncbi:hypothetical protein GOBAR_AA00629 [Gossypium barbadense]|uniref:Uncharacterized protein n=1 Tax=Gossypium barbadense TaxID=3634 RepID=A0A2P5YWF9_GOSBA|nr:hypothetical protein GOBAR_AA00629 [Gossypium barbadense]
MPNCRASIPLKIQEMIPKGSGVFLLEKPKQFSRMMMISLRLSKLKLLPEWDHGIYRMPQKLPSRTNNQVRSLEESTILEFEGAWISSTLPLITLVTHLKRLLSSCIGFHVLSISEQIGCSTEGRTIVEGKTQEIIQETRNLKIRRKGSSPVAENQVAGFNSTLQQPTQLQNQTNHETQLKASRDVAMATAAKAKLLLRELKTVKADLAFAKERCAQLEEENRILRECREKGDNPADDDLIRVQLESLLAEKARLAHENSVYARENRFLREIVEYHQLSMQDVVYLDEGAEEVTEIGYPINFPYSKMLCESPPSSSEVVEVSPSSFPCTSTKEEILHVTSPKQEANDASNSNSPSPTSPTSLPPHHGRETQDARTTPPLSSVQI